MTNPGRTNLLTSSRSTGLTDEELAAVRAPVNDARTLPNFAFTSPEWFEREVSQIFLRAWVAAAFEREVSNPGDVLPFTFLGMPLVAIRDAQGRLKVFHNVCPYDACPVALRRESGAAELRVAYHGWRYRLDGTLIETPFWPDGQHPAPARAAENIDDTLNLVEVPCGTFLGVIFICFAERPPNFGEHVAPLQRLLDPWNLDATATGAASIVEGGPGQIYDVEANWKTYYENTCLNVLHEGFTHELYARSDLVPRVRKGAKQFWEHVDGDVTALAYDHSAFSAAYPEFGLPTLGKSQPPGTGYYAAHFPSLHIALNPYAIVLMIALPVAPGRTRVEQSFLLHSGAAVSHEHRVQREVLYYAWRLASLEDKRIIEAVQQTRATTVFDQKPFSPFWDVMHHRFNNMVLDWMVSEG